MITIMMMTVGMTMAMTMRMTTGMTMTLKIGPAVLQIIKKRWDWWGFGRVMHRGSRVQKVSYHQLNVTLRKSYCTPKFWFLEILLAHTARNMSYHNGLRNITGLMRCKGNVNELWANSLTILHNDISNPTQGFGRPKRRDQPSPATKVLAKRKRRNKSTTTIAMKKRTAAINS